MNSNDFSEIIKIDSILLDSKRQMCLLNDNLLCAIGNNMEFYIIDISSHEIINKIIFDENLINVNSKNKCLNGMILCSFQYKEKNSIIQLKYEKGKNL